MTDPVAMALVARLKSLGGQPWIEDVNGRRIEIAEEQRVTEDNRTPVIASLNDLDCFVVKPIARPDGLKWFIRIDIPGIAQPQIIYADDPLAVLQRAEDVGFLKFALRYERPQPIQQPAPQNLPRKRTGDFL